MAAYLSEVGKSFSGTPRAPAEIATYAEALADMLCGYIGGLGRRMGPADPARRDGSPRPRPAA